MRGSCPVVKLILKTKLDIELISHKETFEITRNSESSLGYEIIKCKLRGIKKKVIIGQVETEDELEQGIRWVTMEGAEYNLEAKEILFFFF